MVDFQNETSLHRRQYQEYRNGNFFLSSVRHDFECFNEIYPSQTHALGLYKEYRKNTKIERSYLHASLAFLSRIQHHSNQLIIIVRMKFQKYRMTYF